VRDLNRKGNCILNADHSTDIHRLKVRFKGSSEE